MPDWRGHLLPGSLASNGLEEDRLDAPEGWDPEPGPGGVTISANQMMLASGSDRRQIYEAVALKLVAGGTYRREGWLRERWTIRVPHAGYTLRDAVRRLIDDWLPLRSVAEMRWFKRVAQLAEIGVDDFPDAWIDDYLSLADDYGHSDNYSELRAVAFGSADELSRLSRRVVLRRDGIAAMAMAPQIDGELRDVLAAGLSPGTPILVGTCLEPDFGKSCAAPSRRMAGRLMAIEPGPMRDVAIADCCDAVENGDLAHEAAIARAHYLMSIVLKGVVAGDLREIRRRIRAFLDGRILKRMGPYARLEAIWCYIACAGRMSDWAAEPVPEALREWLLENIPVMPRDPAFYAMLERRHAALEAKGLGRRKRRSDPIAASFDDMQGMCEAQYAAVVEFADECDKGHAAAGEDPDFAFSYPSALPGPFGRDTGRTMLVNLRSMTIGHMMSRVNACFHPGRGLEWFTFTHSLGGAMHDPEFCAQRVIVYEGVEAQDGGEQPDDPAWLRHFKYGASLPPRKMSTKQIELRRAFLAASGLGLYHRATPGAFHYSEERLTQLATWAFVALGLVVVPVVDVLRGAALARTIFTVGSLTLCRFGAMRQMRDTPEGWGVAETTDKRRLPAIRVIPKLSHSKRSLPLEEKQVLVPFEQHVVTVVRDLIDTLLDLEGDDSDAPGSLQVAFRDVWMPAECADDRYIIQSNGVVLSSAGAAHCLTCLFGRRILTHDLRHAGSARQYEDGDSLTDVGRTAGHTGTGRTRKYVQRGDGRVVGGGKRALALRDAIPSGAARRSGRRRRGVVAGAAS